ncbi:DUF349 domain-containing protein [Comamonas nitrativorans]|uniref:DUF349 domain-containing protein n=1 Tax=Comamonas nitrativorans TaxID=108437 RepID=A0ABV9H0N2_9BURK
MSDATELTSTSGNGADVHPLDTLTGGAFSAQTSGERATCLRAWLASDPSAEQLQEVMKELGNRDKGATRLLRERLDDMRRAQDQDLIVGEWAASAQALLQAPHFSAEQAALWQRDAAKAGAPLSREPLASLKAQLLERAKGIEELQHKVQVQREVAVLLAQRIEVLSTKPWKDAEAALDGLQADVTQWRQQALSLRSDAGWACVPERFTSTLETSEAQLLLVWQAFLDALAVTKLAAEDANAALPAVPVWADEIRVARGMPSELAVPAAVAKPDPAAKQHAAQAALQPLLQSLADAPPQDKAAAIAQVRSALKQHGRWLDAALAGQVHEQLLAAGDTLGWQPQQADTLRQQLIEQAVALTQNPQGGRKLQDALRHLRDQWRQIDQGAAPNHGLWKKFDEACTQVHQQVQQWLGKVRAESTQHKADRQALIDEVKAWAQTPVSDWKEAARALRQFGQRWRDGGHVGEKAFAELQAAWKEAIHAAEAPLRAAQKESIAQREALISQVKALHDAPGLAVDAIKTLQQQWQALAQAVPLERKLEQKLWDAFRAPVDALFQRKSAERSRAPAQALSAYDRAVLDAAQALQAANAGGDAQQIRAALNALEAARQQVPQDPSAQTTPAAAQDAAPAAAAAVAVERPVVAVRGDDRPGAKKEAAPQTGRDLRGSGKERRPDQRPPRADRAERGPRLSDAAFRAQRDAVDAAQHALRKLTAQAHGEAVGQLLQAWAQRDAAALPSGQELGKLPAAARNSWGQALADAPKGDAGPSLLRLEIAADVPTPAEQHSQRRMLQLQLLTQRNAAMPQETWTQDVAAVLATAHGEATARRLQNVLKALLRK